MRGRTHGFMLLEILVAMAILAIGMTGLMFGLTSSLDRAKRTKEYSTAIFLAQHVMMEEEHVYAFSDEVATTRRGSFYEEGLAEFQWVSDTQLDRELMQYEISVTVTWEHKRRPLKFTITQLVPSHRESIEELGRTG